MANLGPLTRSEHRAKTVGGWRAKQPDPGLYVWRSPEGEIVITTNQGTLVLGGSAYTHHLWRTAGKAPSRLRCRRIGVSVACAGGLRQAWRRRTGRLSS